MPYTFERPPELRDLNQVYSYLYRMSEELEGALNNITSSDIKDLETKVESALAKGTGNATGTAALDQKANELKALIVMTADNVQSAMDEIVTELHGNYVASSDFGTYSLDYFRQITNNAYGDENIYQYMTQVQAGNDSFIQNTQARIRTGLLYVDDGGTAHYGVAVGEEILDKTYTYNGEPVTGVDTTKTLSMFTSDELQFWIGDNKVAYISNQELFVTRGRFMREIRIGNIAGVIDGTDPSIVRWYVKG